MYSAAKKPDLGWMLVVADISNRYFCSELYMAANNTDAFTYVHA